MGDPCVVQEIPEGADRPVVGIPGHQHNGTCDARQYMLDERADQLRFHMDDVAATDFSGDARELRYRQLHSTLTADVGAVIDDHVGTLAQAFTMDEMQWLSGRTVAGAPAQLVLVAQPMAAHHDRVAVVRGGEGVRKQVLGAKPQLLGGKPHAAVLGPAPDRAADRLVTLVAGRSMWST